MDPVDSSPSPGLLPRTQPARTAFWAMVGVALLMRLAAWLERVDRGTFDGMLDTRIYRQIAAQLPVEGWIPPQAFFMSPLYPYLMAITGAQDGGPAVTLIASQILLGVAALVVLALAARSLGGELAAFAVLLIGAFAAPLVLYDTSLLPDGPAAACVGLAVGAMVLRDRARRRGLVLAGAALALGVLLRSNLLLLTLLLVVLLLVQGRARPRRALGDVGALGGPVMVALLLISGANLAAEGLWAPRSYNGGLNLYIGNNPSAEGTYTTVNEIHPGDPMGRAVAERARGRGLHSAEVEDFWREQALDYLMRARGEAIALLGAKLLFFLHPLELPQMEDLALARRESLALAVSRIGWGGVLALALLGWMRGPDRLRQRASPLALAFLAALVVGLVFFVNGRLRMPAWPALLPVAAVGVVVLWRATRERRMRALLLPLVLIVLLRLLTFFADPHASFVHARSAARYAALEALEGNRAYAQQWLAAMDEFVERPAIVGEGRAIDATLREKPDAVLMLRTERAAALYALGDLRGAFEELYVVTRERPGFLRAQRGMLDVADRLLRSGADDPRLREARDAAARALGAGQP